MSISKFWKEAVAYRLGGGHTADHKALLTPSYSDSTGTALITPSGGTAPLPLSLFSGTINASTNSTAIQNALNKGGIVSIVNPGIYYTYDSLCIGSNTKLLLGTGVRLLNSAPSGRNVIRSSNAAWSALDNHVLSNITVLCATGGAIGVGTINYTYTSNSGIISTTIAYGTTTFANVVGTLSYQSPGDSSAGAPVAIVGFPGGKMKLLSGNGIDTIWVSVGNSGKSNGTLAALAQSFMPSSNVTERVLITANGNATPKNISWTFTTVGGKQVITVYEPNHGRNVGDKIEMLKGSGLEGLFEVYNIGDSSTYGNSGTGNVSSSSSWKNQNGTIQNYWTILPNTTLNVSYWSGLPAAGTAYVWGLRNIFIEGGGEVNYNRIGHTFTPSDNSGDTIFFNGVSQYGVTGVSIPDGNAHSYFQTNCSKGVNSPGECYSPYGSHNLRGPIRDVQLYRTKGRSDDNNADCGTSDYANFVVHFGYENSSIGTISATDVFDVRYNGNNSDQAYEVTRLYCVAGTQLIGFTGSDYFGRNNEQAVQGLSMITDEICVPNISPSVAAALAGGSGASGYGGYMSSITWNNIAVKNNPYFGTPTIVLGAGVTFGVVTINGLDYAQSSVANGFCINQSGNVDHLIINSIKRREDSRYGIAQGATTGFIGLTGNGATANRITIRDADCIFTQATGVSNSGLWKVNPTGVINDFDILDSTITDGNWTLASASVAASGSGYITGDTITIPYIGVGASSAVGTVTAVSGAVTAVSISGGSYFNSTRPTNPAVTTTSGVGVGCTLNLVWASIGNKKSFVIFNSGTIARVRTRNCTYINVDSLSFNNTAISSGTPMVTASDTQLTGNYIVNNGSALTFPGLNLTSVTGSVYRLVSSNHTTGTIPLRLVNCGGLLPGSATIYSGGGTYGVYGFDYPVDITQSSIVKTIAGQFTKTAIVAGTIPAGRLVACDGTNWKCIDNTSLLY